MQKTAYSTFKCSPLAFVILPATLPLPHAFPRTANGLLNIGRERRRSALVCEFMVEGIKFRPEGSFRQRFLPAPAVIRHFHRLHAKRQPVNRTFFKALSDPRRQGPQAARGTRLFLLGCGQQRSTSHYAFRRAFLPIFHSQLLFGYDLSPCELSFGLCCRLGRIVRRGW
jgi:hypothetical protein